MKKVIAALSSFAMALWVGIGAYLIFFQSSGGEKNGRQQEEAVKAEEHKPEKKPPAKETPMVTGAITSVITTVSEENDWRLETPIDTLNFDDLKDRDKARRKIARDIRIGNRKALEMMKESTAEEKEKREQTEAIDAWLEKETRQGAIE